MSKPPKVSVVTVTYNQAGFIKQTLDSLLMQKTDFEFEVIVADDASTDKTPDIIKQYAKDHPDIIKPTLRAKNVGVLANFTGAMRAAAGDYIALCEGDDYWTDPQKLQLQADFMDANPRHALCFHPVKVTFEDNSKKPFVYPKAEDSARFTLKGLLQENYIQTNSVMYRRQDYKVMPSDILPVDWYLHLYHAQFGDIGFINQTMSVYRRHPGGVWWNSQADISKIWQKHGVAHLSLYVEFLKLYGHNKDYAEIINAHIYKLLNNLIETDNQHAKQLVAQAAGRFPETLDGFVKHQQAIIKQQQAELGRDKSEINSLEQTVMQKDQHIEHLKGQLATIRASRVWKARNKAAKLTGKDAL